MLFRTPSLLLLCALLVGLPAHADHDIVVIANTANPIEKLDRRQLIDLYMGRIRAFEDGNQALTLDQPPASPTRIQFYRQLVNKSVAEVNAYWARLLFTGRATPPRSVGGAEEMLKVVRDNKSAIGYINRDYLDGSVKIIGHVD